MINFMNDYCESAHPNVLDWIVKTNMDQTIGYGDDQYTLEAIRLIQKKLNDDTVDIHFISGGTQTNLLSIAAFLRPHEAVVTTESSHIVEHETGAIEATGHKIFTVPRSDGKLDLDMLKEVVKTQNNPFTPLPKLVSLTLTTEYGTVYTKDELESFKRYCRENDLYLYIDGARLGTGLASDACDIEYSDLTSLCDAFYIGGTKNGTLYGEALVIVNDELKPYFAWNKKQRGAMLSKGKPLGVQFIALFEDDLYEENAKHANNQAKKIADVVMEKKYELMCPVDANLIFVYLPNALIEKMKEMFWFSVIKTGIDTSLVRLVTNFATTDEQVKQLINILSKGEEL